MRSIICRFKDEADFLNHLRHGGRRRGPTFTLVARVDLDAGETLQLHGFVSNLREDLKVDVTVFEKSRVALDDGSSGTAFRYVCVVEPADAVWVEMFVQKLTMMRDVRLVA